MMVFIGWDPSQMRVWNVAARSLQRHASRPVEVERLDMIHLRHRGLYWRPTEAREHGYWDVISDAPMSTGHAISRFLVPALCDYNGWALFTDGDVLFRRDVSDLFALADPMKAVQVVQHAHVPSETTKMDGHMQTLYMRKNWSSVVLWNCSHQANRALTVDLVNTIPGRDLHRFCWLEDCLVGKLPPLWNWLVGHSDVAIDPAIVHFTDGDPSLPGYEQQPFADEWREVANACGYTLSRPMSPPPPPDTGGLTKKSL